MKLLTFSLAQTASLTISDIEEMYSLFSESYSSVTPQLFDADLSWKDYTGLLRDSNGRIQGFSTMALNPRNFTADYDILFSGDTVISRTHWGTQELVRGFCRTAGRILAERKRPLYWYLISKGHRTYLYLPLFCKTYYPSRRRRDDHLAAIAHTVSTHLYPHAWQKHKGILAFQESHGELKEHLARATLERTSPDIEFFLQKNPGFAQGTELVCTAALSPENLRGFARRFLLQGMSAA